MELLERVLENNNLYQAIAKVVSNKGSGGVDGMNVEDGSKYFMKNIETIKDKLVCCVLNLRKAFCVSFFRAATFCVHQLFLTTSIVTYCKILCISMRKE